MLREGLLLDDYSFLPRRMPLQFRPQIVYSF
jgi:hypothetical protein